MKQQISRVVLHSSPGVVIESRSYRDLFYTADKHTLVRCTDGILLDSVVLLQPHPLQSSRQEL